jgi:hypothetical protein
MIIRVMHVKKALDTPDRIPINYGKKIASALPVPFGITSPMDMLLYTCDACDACNTHCVCTVPCAQSFRCIPTSVSVVHALQSTGLHGQGTVVAIFCISVHSLPYGTGKSIQVI